MYVYIAPDTGECSINLYDSIILNEDRVIDPSYMGHQGLYHSRDLVHKLHSAGDASQNHMVGRTKSRHGLIWALLLT